MVQTLTDSGGKSWLKEISMTVRLNTEETAKQKNAASPCAYHALGRRRLFDHDT
jgi:hypothetical protein